MDVRCIYTCIHAFVYTRAYRQQRMYESICARESRKLRGNVIEFSALAVLSVVLDTSRGEQQSVFVLHRLVRANRGYRSIAATKIRRRA